MISVTRPISVTAVFSHFEVHLVRKRWSISIYCFFYFRSHHRQTKLVCFKNFSFRYYQTVQILHGVEMKTCNYRYNCTIKQRLCSSHLSRDLTCTCLSLSRRNIRNFATKNIIFSSFQKSDQKKYLLENRLKFRARL